MYSIDTLEDIVIELKVALTKDDDTIRSEVSRQIARLNNLLRLERTVEKFKEMSKKEKDLIIERLREVTRC